MKRTLGLSGLLVAGCLFGFAASSSAQTLFSDNFDRFGSPVTVTTAGPAQNGYDILFNALNGVSDFTVIFGFDYSTVTIPTNIPSAPNSGGTTRGLFLSVNKDATGSPAGVNLYPTNLAISGDYVLKFDLWMNYSSNFNTSTEQALAGINMSGTIPNRPGQTSSDGLFFAMNGDGGSSGTSTTLRDFSCFEGTGGAPILMLTNTGGVTFGPTPPLGGNFAHTDAAIAALFPSKTMVNFSTIAGAPGFRWLNVEVRYIGGVATWAISNNIIAQYANPTGYGSGNIMLGYSDFFASIGSNTDYAIFDNIRVEKTTGVSVNSSIPNAYEQGPVAGQFTISRTGDTSSNLTVNYTLTGTASNGLDYVTLPGSAIIPAGLSSVDIPVTPIDDAIAEPTETVVLTLNNATNYYFAATAGATNSATISIFDNETPTVFITATQPTMYERQVGDYITYQVTRWGDLNVDITANLTYSGTAVRNTHYTNVTDTLEIPPNVATQTFTITPIDDNVFTGNHTVICTVNSGAGFVVGAPAAATGTILDDEYPPETILFADSFANDTSASWKTTFGANNAIFDASVSFAFDVTSDSVPTPPDGTNAALKVTVNKTNATAGGAAGVNLYPIGRSFGGDYAMRFDMYLTQGNTVGSATEFASFGINHSGNATNWYRGSATNAANPTSLPLGCDGFFYAICADGSSSAPGNFALLTGTNTVLAAPAILRSATAASMADVFKEPPFNPSGAGSPSTLAVAPAPNWVSVEVAKVGAIVTMSMDKTVILNYTNTSTANTSGNIMLGYMDPYDSVGTLGWVYYSNLRVVGFVPTTPAITSVTSSGGQVTIKFTGATNDAPASFHLQSTAALANPNTFADATATITGSNGSYQAVAAVSGSQRFYRIRR